MVLTAMDLKSWQEVGRFEAVGPDAAKEAAFEKLSKDTDSIGALVAIADRNWNPEEFEVDEEVVRTIKPKGQK